MENVSGWGIFLRGKKCKHFFVCCCGCSIWRLIKSNDKHCNKIFYYKLQAVLSDCYHALTKNPKNAKISYNEQQQNLIYGLLDLGSSVANNA